MPNTISTKCNVFLQLIILHPHPHFTSHVRIKIRKTIRILHVWKSADPQICILPEATRWVQPLSKSWRGPIRCDPRYCRLGAKMCTDTCRPRDSGNTKHIRWRRRRGRDSFHGLEAGNAVQPNHLRSLPLRQRRSSLIGDSDSPCTVILLSVLLGKQDHLLISGCSVLAP